MIPEEDAGRSPKAPGACGFPSWSSSVCGKGMASVILGVLTSARSEARCVRRPAKARRTCRHAEPAPADTP